MVSQVYFKVGNHSHFTVNLKVPNNIDLPKNMAPHIEFDLKSAIVM